MTVASFLFLNGEDCSSSIYFRTLRPTKSIAQNLFILIVHSQTGKNKKWHPKKQLEYHLEHIYLFEFIY